MEWSASPNYWGNRTGTRFLLTLLAQMAEDGIKNALAFVTSDTVPIRVVGSIGNIREDEIMRIQRTR